MMKNSERKKSGSVTMQSLGIVLLCIVIAGCLIKWGDSILNLGQTRNAQSMGTGWERFDYENIDEQLEDESDRPHFMESGEY